jgi:hypothetical protein
MDLKNIRPEILEVSAMVSRVVNMSYLGILYSKNWGPRILMGGISKVCSYAGERTTLSRYFIPIK